MNSGIIFIYNLITSLLPETKFFGLKRNLLKKAGAEIGENVRICSSAKILGNGHLIIGDNTWVGINALIITTNSRQKPNTFIKIGRNVDIAPGVYLGTGTHIVDINADNVAGEGTSDNILIGDGCWLGAKSAVLPGVEIGAKTIVAAGALVNKNLQGLSVYGGVPAKFIKKLD